jgi:cation:H+ antiporter
VNVVLLLASFAVLLAGALLFTNAVEWLGHRMNLGQGAVGSLLAAVATALPESLIPIVAIVSGAQGSEEVAIGAIIGAPFMLATIAMALVGVSALIYRKRRPQGSGLKAHFPTIERDLSFFLVFFGLGLALGLFAPRWLQFTMAVVFVLAYAVYVRRTLSNSGDVQEFETLNPLIMDLARGSEPPLKTVIVQIIVALGAIIGGADLFVHEILEIAEHIGIEPLVLSLVLAPLATELPEKANSFFWVREGKDSLALGNITGAMVFQSTMPIALGLALTDWELGRFSLLAGALGLVGGAIAIWALHIRRRFVAPAIVAWAVLWLIFLTAVLVGG